MFGSIKESLSFKPKDSVSIKRKSIVLGAKLLLQCHFDLPLVFSFLNFNEVQ